LLAHFRAEDPVALVELLLGQLRAELAEGLGHREGARDLAAVGPQGRDFLADDQPPREQTDLASGGRHVDRLHVDSFQVM